MTVGQQQSGAAHMHRGASGLIILPNQSRTIMEEPEENSTVGGSAGADTSAEC